MQLQYYKRIVSLPDSLKRISSNYVEIISSHPTRDAASGERNIRR